uniref:Ribonuclease H-like domain-containing protein n=1 Tax=Tanacetum cinerariifolium TaxID=118510 RepID=A0A6L2LMA1_TANCI|nr:ribonuclease H-like domain-containing protein [Tanacetum cinerariifolium]
MAPRAVLMKTGLRTLNTARPVNTAHPKITVYSARPMPKVVNTVKLNSAVVNAVRANQFNAVKASACWGNPRLELQEKGVINSGCSRHMTGNMSYLSEYEEINGGYVAFGGDPKGGKINGKGKISTVNVLLSSDFKLLDESQVLLRVTRKNNMYSVDLKNVAPSGGLTCLFANATLDESDLCHGRLGHINFKTMNKSIRGNLVRDPLGKFDGNADEGFFVEYSVNSNAFKVFNSRTRIVEKTLHITFLENKPNVAGSEPTWLFDIDTLTKSMNYKPVVAENQSNSSVGKAIMETVPDKDYILLPLWTQDLLFSSSFKDSPGAGCKPSGEEEKKDAGGLENIDSEVPSTEEPRINQEKDANVNSSNNINDVSLTINVADIEDNAVDENIVYGCADDPNMPNLEEVIYSDDDEEVGVEADMTNLDTNIPVSPIPTTRIHKDQLVEQIIEDIHSTPQTIRIKKNVSSLASLDIGGFTKWIEAIRLFLAYASFKDFVVYQMDVKSAFLYDKIEEEVYVYQPSGFEDPEFHDRVYKVEKALYGLHQAPRAWKDMCIEFEKTMHKKFQMSSMGELTFFLGLQVTQKDDGIFISQDKYVDKTLKKFGFLTVKTASTPIETSKPLLKDENAEDVDVHLYRSMISSLMYLTSSKYYDMR